MHGVKLKMFWMVWSLSLLTLLSSSKVNGGTFYWTNSQGGAYSTPANWSPNSLPGDSDSVVFTNAGTYTLAIDSGATNASAFFHQGSITQAIPTAVWLVTNEWRVGESTGSTSQVTASNGLLVVTNAAGSGVLSVGRIGSGELAIRGGDVVADTLVATDGSRSLLTLAYGSLTTLRGVTVNNGTLVLGLVTNAPFVWNIVGGNNQLLNGGFAGYGGLTLGVSSGAGRSVVNLGGSNVSLTVHGLDTYGNNRLNIQGGATFHTHSVQLGLQSVGVSNVVTIADPGSSWINDYLMYFGMHSGAQTMVISNGGYFKTGGTTYSDQDFSALDLPGSKIIITGSNSWFHSDGGAAFGISWSSPVSPLNNLLLVTNGGRFWARELTYGSTSINLGSVSRPGNVINIADGSMWIGSLTFGVGTLRVAAGNGTIDQLNMTGGTNAVLQTLGNLYVGHHGNLGAGELRIGGVNTTIASLNGELQLAGWQLGAFAGDNGDVTMTGGRAFITNGSQTASLVVGGGGSGILRVKGGLVQADALAVGPGSTVIVTNGATLRINACTAPSSTVQIKSATLEFSSDTPNLSSNAIVTTNSTISFVGTTNAQVDLNNPAFLGRIQRFGQTTLQLVQSTNSSLAPLVFRSNDASAWSRLVFNGGTSLVQAGGFLIETNSSLAATNTTATLAGGFTNRGQLILNNSTLRFAGPVTLSGTFGFQGTQGFLIFDGGLHLPATDVVVPAGIAVQASSITSDGGKLVISGGAIVPNADGTVASGMVLFQNGWVTYLDADLVPLTPPGGLTGGLGLELIRSTNAPAFSQTFASSMTGYERLRMGSKSSWRSQQLVIGQGGGMFMVDPTASVTLTSGVFRVEQGGIFRDDTGGTSHIGFNSSSSNASATVSGDGSAWLTPNAVSIGAGGSQNQLLVEFGGKLAANSVGIGGSGANNNRLVLNGAGATCFATNGLTIAGIQNQFLIQTGGVFTGSQILAGGSSSVISLSGLGTIANCSTQVVVSGSGSKLLVSAGANLFTSNAVLNAFSDGSADISGANSLWKLSGGLTINSAFSSFSMNQVVVRSKGVVAASGVTLSTSAFGRALLSVSGGQLFVTNSLGTGTLNVGGLLELNGGFLRADKLTASSSSATAVNLRSGRMEWVASDFASGVPLRIGDGANFAALKLLGGTNILRSGLDIRRYAALTGSGVIIGATTNRGWFSPAVMTMQNNLVLDSTSELMFTLAGAPGNPQNSSLVVTGSVSLAGKLGILLPPGAIISNSDSFILLQSANITSNFSNVIFGQRLFTADRLASFRIDNTGTALVATDFQSEDLDGDGIQDAWATQHFGVSPLLPGTGTNDLDGDWDGDGLSNRNEFLLGTDPNDASSGLVIQLEKAGSGMKVHFPYLQGRSYSVSTSSDLSNWAATLVEEFGFDSNGLAVWSDTSTLGIGKRFYRLLVQ